VARIAWFSPLPPSTSGIAAYSAEILPLLHARAHEIDTYTDSNAHEFVWRHRRHPYELTVYQLGNASCHDYMWAYLFRYPGLVVLHDAQLHQARALFLTRRWTPRLNDYMAEVQANHPDAPADLPYLVLARLADRMYQHWPMIKLVLERAKLTLVHNRWLAQDLREKYPAAEIRAIEMGVAPPVLTQPPRRPPSIPENAVVVGAFGGVTPEKRIPQLIRALGAIAERHSHVHLMLVGGSAAHYDPKDDAQACGVSERVHRTGFVADDELAAYVAGADICACLRWPTNRETSASWLRCLAAGRPTIITELAHLGDVPTLDPRGWRVLDTERAPRAPVAVSIDPLDEDQSLQIALERLVSDAQLRGRLGRAAHEWWSTHHQLHEMASGYDDAIRHALAGPVRSPALPDHLLADGTSALRVLAATLDQRDRVRDLL
jgi:glycosyltransferase involved in cell wall biosynthesis